MKTLFILLLLVSKVYADDYAVIDVQTNKVVNVVVWDGVAPWQKPDNTEITASEDMGISDEVKIEEGKWKKVKKPKEDTEEITP